MKKDDLFSLIEAFFEKRKEKNTRSGNNGFKKFGGFVILIIFGLGCIYSVTSIKDQADGKKIIIADDSSKKAPVPFATDSKGNGTPPWIQNPAGVLSQAYSTGWLVLRNTSRGLDVFCWVPAAGNLHPSNPLPINMPGEPWGYQLNLRVLTLEHGWIIFPVGKINGVSPNIRKPLSVFVPSPKKLESGELLPVTSDWYNEGDISVLNLEHGKIVIPTDLDSQPIFIPLNNIE